MPLDVRGSTRATMDESYRAMSVRTWESVKFLHDWDRGLELSPVNEEFLVGASHQLAPNKSMPFVHTARRYHRLNVLVRSSDWRSQQPSGRCVLPGR
jgi:hypothetical protein